MVFTLSLLSILHTAFLWNENVDELGHLTSRALLFFVLRQICRVYSIASLISNNTPTPVIHRKYSILEEVDNFVATEVLPTNGLYIPRLLFPYCKHVSCAL